jgi:hypothetical protein
LVNIFNCFTYDWKVKDESKADMTQNKDVVKDEIKVDVTQKKDVVKEESNIDMTQNKDVVKHDPKQGCSQR